MRFFFGLIGVAAIAVAVGIGVSGPGVRMGWWEYGTGLTMIRQLALPALALTAISILCVVISLFKARAMAPLLIIATAAVGVGATVPLKMRQNFENNPFIHDVTTDFQQPPQIVAAAKLARSNPPEYLGDEVVPRSELTLVQSQKQAFPDIAPVSVAKPLSQTAEHVRDALAAMKIEILAETPIDDGLRIEGVYVSAWFGFKDDFVVRLTGDGTGTKIDVRSKSRVGGSDLGANAARVREFLVRMASA